MSQNAFKLLFCIKKNSLGGDMNSYERLLPVASKLQVNITECPSSFPRSFPLSFPLEPLLFPPQGQKLGVSGHRGHQWIDAYAFLVLIY